MPESELYRLEDDLAGDSWIARAVDTITTSLEARLKAETLMDSYGGEGE